MPLRPERLNHRIRHRLPTPLTLGTEPIGMTINTPRIPILLHKRGIMRKRIATLRTKEVTRVPLRTTRDNDLSLNRRRATLTPGTETLVEIQMAVEPRRLVGSIPLLQLRHFLRRVPAGQELDVLAALAGADALNASAVFGRGFRVEGDAFEFLAALVAAEAVGVEATASCGDDAAADGERARGALGACADGGGGPVGAGGGGEGPGGGGGGEGASGWRLWGGGAVGIFAWVGKGPA